MGIFKEAGETIVKYGELLISKTERLSKIAKLKIDIKRIELDIGIAEKETGRFVIEKIEKGETSIDLNEPKLRELKDKIDDFKKQIRAKRDEIEKIKSEAGPSKDQGAAQ
jgi:tRNA uridine 5-carbamoylmethylation protein Kti12